MVEPLKAEITLIGNDPSLAYLISRFAEKSGYQVTVQRGSLSIEEICTRKPCLVLFSSIENLESAQTLVNELADSEIPVAVCASMSDEARAHELGADHCLLHPLTYDGFLAAFQGENQPGSSGSNKDEPQAEA